jgi:hypothetical protein
VIKQVLAVAAAAVAVAAVGSAPALAAGDHGSGGPAPSHSARGHTAFSYAVYGDAPYGTSPTDTSEFDATPAFIASVNADPDVSTVVHVGDIHSGSQYCTASYDRAIQQLWTGFTDPLVYTPGDNEWTDCHKAKEGGGTYDAGTGQIDYVLDPGTGRPVDYANGNPVANLALVRSVFFPQPGRTLGSGTLRVLSQAQVRDPRHPADAQYVENVVWRKKQTLFVTINVPGGSNNDADPWYGAPTASAEQQSEAAQRTGADLRWLDFAFGLARTGGIRDVVIVTQADMWDLDGKTPAHLTDYEPLISSIAAHTARFGRPVLLLNGDSHVYRSDNPLQQNSACTGDAGVCATDAWAGHPYYDVPNFHRIVVHGSTVPLEWLKLTVDPQADAPASATAFGPFSWQRITG